MQASSVLIRLALRRRRAAAIVLGLAVLSFAMPHLRRPGDIEVYLKAAGRLVQHEQFYRPDDPPPFTYPPFFALPFVPLLWLPDAVRLSAWWFFNLSLAAWIVGQVWRALPPATTTARTWAWAEPLCLAVLAARFFISPLEHQSHDLIVLALVLSCGTALAARREGLAGLCGGVAAACKATPLLLLPALVLQSRRRAAVGFLVTLVAATLLPDLLFPNRSGGLWVQSWHERFVSKVSAGRPASAEGAWSQWNPLNQSLSGTIHRLTTRPPAGSPFVDVTVCVLPAGTQRVLTFALQGAVLAALAWTLRPARTAPPVPTSAAFLQLGQIGTVLCGMLLLSPMSSTQHFCALIVPIAFLIGHWRTAGWDPVAAVALAIVFLFGTLGAQDLAGSFAADRLQAFGGSTWCAGACLLASGRALRRMQSVPAESSWSTNRRNLCFSLKTSDQRERVSAPVG